MTAGTGQGWGHGEPDPPGRRDQAGRHHLQPGQFVAETSRPVPRAALSARAVAGLWALRAVVVLIGLMVICTFIDQLR